MYANTRTIYNWFYALVYHFTSHDWKHTNFLDFSCYFSKIHRCCFCFVPSFFKKSYRFFYEKDSRKQILWRIKLETKTYHFQPPKKHNHLPSKNTIVLSYIKNHTLTQKQNHTNTHSP